MFYHKAWIDCGSNITTKRVPTFRVEEVPELLEVIVDEELGGSEIEPRIKLMDNWLVTNDWKYSDHGCYWTYEQENSQAYCWFPLVDSRILAEHTCLIS